MHPAPRIFQWLFFRTLLLCILLPVSYTQAAECERPARLHFSLVPQSDLQKDVASLKPLFADLQAALGIPVEVIMPTSYGAVIEDLLSGAVDLARLWIFSEWSPGAKPHLRRP